jgi:pSer/pThr/pTyr-binding forkhead associated (FHA) protein
MSDFQLRVNPGSADEQVIELEPGSSLKIGRRPESDANKFLINDPAVSGTHAEVWHDGFHWRITDKGSTNGTCLNGRVLIPGDEYVLRHEDEISIAHIRIQVWYSSQEETFRLEALDLGEKSEDQFLAHVKLPSMPVNDLEDE